MILGINSLGTRGGGCETVLRSLLDGIAGSTPCSRAIERVVVFVLPHDAYPFSHSCGPDMQIVACPPVTDNAISRYAWLRTGFQRFLRPHGCDVLLHMSGVAGAVDLPQVVMLQNSLYFCPEAIAAYRRPGVPVPLRLRKMVEVPLALRFFRRSCRDARRIIVQSEVMKGWVERDAVAARGRVHVVRPAMPDLAHPTPTVDDAPSAMRATRGRRLIYVGNNQPYKNLKVLFAAAAMAEATHPDWTFFLTLPQPTPTAPRNVVFLGQLGRREVAGALREADALVMPSLVETVGLPMVEALSLGTPVVAADRPYAREFCSTAAKYFDPHSPASLCAAIARTVGGGLERSIALHEALQLPRPVEFAERMIDHCLAAANAAPLVAADASRFAA
ncbi:MAG: glycosyltransferase [Planctomycetota bacterium]|nr:glycosyltransferase [Planctomycetota bacterium]